MVPAGAFCVECAGAFVLGALFSGFFSFPSDRFVCGVAALKKKHLNVK